MDKNQINLDGDGWEKGGSVGFQRDLELHTCSLSDLFFCHKHVIKLQFTCVLRTQIQILEIIKKFLLSPPI